MNFAIALARAGCEVDLYTALNRTSLRPTMDEPRLRIFFLPGEYSSVKEPVVRLTLRFTRWARRQVRQEHYDAIIGAGVRGLMAAAWIAPRLRLPAVYLCLEQYPASFYTSWKSRLFKLLERRANARMDLTVAQDEMRAAMLAEDNRIRRDSIVSLPVAPLGPAQRCPSDHWRNAFGLHGKKIFLYAGSLFAPFTVERELVRAAQDWPQDWALVIHGSQRYSSEQWQSLSAIDQGRRVHHSREPVPYSRLAELLGSADIGVVMYHANDPNFFYMGLSSGKLAEFLRCGVPCIVSALPGMRELVNEFDCGVAVPGCEDIAAAARNIFTRHADMSANAMRCFDARLALQQHMPRVMAALDAAIRAHRSPAR